MNHKIIRLAGRSYVLSSFTPSTTKKIIITLRGLNAQELKDIPDAVPVMVKAISIAIYGNGILNRFKAMVIHKRLIRCIEIDCLLEATKMVIEMIPVDEFYAVSTITNKFKKTILK